jgi:formylglycine-generating enzyme required for sulfatase activity
VLQQFGEGRAAGVVAIVCVAGAKRQAEAEAKRIVVAARDRVLPKPGAGKTFQDRLADGNPCPMCPEMVVVPAGEFLMGSVGNCGTDKEFPNLADRWKTEGRSHSGSFAVTFAEWDACAADRGCNGYQPDDEGGDG